MHVQGILQHVLLAMIAANDSSWRVNGMMCQPRGRSVPGRASLTLQKTLKVCMSGLPVAPLVWRLACNLPLCMSINKTGQNQVFYNS